MESKSTLKVMTLNCWGVVFVAQNRRARMHAIAKHLSRCNLDLVSLQEVWSIKDYIFLSTKAKSCLPYSHYFNSGVTGPGLCVLSKHPILDVYFHQWPINGYAHKVHQGDWFGGKGVGLCKIQYHDQIIHFYTTHLHAEYDLEKLDYLNHRILQAFDTSQFIKLTSRDCDLAILAGDLNSEPHDLAISLLLLNAQLMDSFQTAQLKSAGCIGTNESYRNSYARSKEIQRQPEGQRIDYILYRSSPKFQVKALEYLFPLPDRVPGCTFSYSDHEAVEVIFECSTAQPESKLNGVVDPVNEDEPNQRLRTALNASVNICADSLNKLSSSRRFYLSAAVLLCIALVATLFVELFYQHPLHTVSYTFYVVLYNLLKVVLTGLFLFTLFMGTIWNSMEQSAILTGKFSMKLLLNQMSNPKMVDDSL